jgi:Kef-type K+ transport system membrane component KefB
MQRRLLALIIVPLATKMAAVAVAAAITAAAEAVVFAAVAAGAASRWALGRCSRRMASSRATREIPTAPVPETAARCLGLAAAVWSESPGDRDMSPWRVAASRRHSQHRSE